MSKAHLADAHDSSDALSEDRIVRVALNIAQREGMEKLTMRTLAAELGVTQMAAYYHLKNKDHLLDLVVDAAHADVVVPGREDGDWDVRLKLLCQRQFEARRLVRDLSGHIARGKIGPQQLRLYNAQVAILSESGLDDDGVMRAFALVQTYMVGRYVLADRLRGPGKHRLEKILGKRAAQDSSITLVDFALDTIIAGLKSRIEQ